MVRTTIIPVSTDIHLTIPKEYIGKTIEITYLDMDELKSEYSTLQENDMIHALNESEADYRAGRIHTHEEVGKHIRAKIDGFSK